MSNNDFAHIQHLQHLASRGVSLDAAQQHALHVYNTTGVALRQGAAPKAGTTATPTPVQSQTDVNLLNSQRDASTILSNLFAQYGLGSLAPRIVDYIKQGYSNDAITVLLQQTPEYKQRFAANDARVKAGLPALSPSQYIATEESYRQVMSAAGLPTGFYDSPDDFTRFLANDMSPTELQQRVNVATEAVNKAPQQAKDYFSQWYGQGDMIAYALDPARAEPLIEQRFKAAEAAGVGATQNLNLTQNQAENIGNTGVTLDQIRQGMGIVGQNAPTAAKLDSVYGDNVTQDDLVNQVFLNDGQADKKVAKLASAERANFNGSSGTSSNSLGSGATTWNQ